MSQARPILSDKVDPPRPGSLFAPRSIVVIGSSRLKGGMATPAAYMRVIDNLTRYQGGPLHVVDLEQPTVPMPRAELGVLLLPAGQTLEWARKAVLECGCKAMVLLNGGFTTFQRIQLRKLVAENGVAMLGPNSILGLMDTSTGLDTSFEADFFPDPGRVALVCQSGGVGAMLMDLARGRGQGLSKVIFPGDKVGLGDADIMAYLAQDEATRAIALYVEGLADGGRFRRVVARMTRDKPLVALKGGASEAAAARAKSHTASLAGNARLFAAAIRSAGGLMVETPEELLTVADGLSRLPRLNGSNLALISNVGGPAIILADALSSAGFHLPRLAGEAWVKVRESFPMVETINPVDLIADADGHRFGAAVLAAIGDPHVHVIVVVTQLRSTFLRLEQIDELNAVIPEACQKPIVAVCPGSPQWKEVARRLPWPTYASPAEAVTVLTKLQEWSRRRVQVTLETGEQ